MSRPVLSPIELVGSEERERRRCGRAQQFSHSSYLDNNDADDSDETDQMDQTNISQNTPFQWHGDAEVPVETVLDHLDGDFEPQKRWIKQSIEKHREQGEPVDAADIRWVAEASEEMDLEGDHPFRT